MNHLHQAFSVRFTYTVFFTEQLFDTRNSLLADFLKQQSNDETRKKLLFVLDSGVVDTHPTLQNDIRRVL